MTFCIRNLKLIIFICLACTFTSRADAGESEVWLNRLDSLIANEEEFTLRKQKRIDEIKHESKKIRTDEEQYWHNRRLYDEYYVFDVDSAMSYVLANLDIARRLGNRNWENEWKIRQAFGLSVMGLLKDAEEVLNSINSAELPAALRTDFYIQKAYLYSHLSQLADHRDVGGVNYDRLSNMYEDSTFMHLPKDNPLYLSHRGSALYNTPDATGPIIAELKKVVDGSTLENRQDAINAYVLSRLYDDRGDMDNRIRYLAMSGCVDVATSNRDIASLEELADILMQRGDIDRAYKYINYCSRQALKLPNRVRAASLARTETHIHKLYVDKLESTRRDLEMTLWGLGAVLIIVILLIIALVSRARKLGKSRRELAVANEQLSVRLEELTASRAQEKRTLADLKAANKRNSEINDALKEANFVKEACIGATFALCSSYIDRLDKFRRTVARLVRSNSWKELRDEVSNPSVSNEDLKDFYRNFDTLFLGIYPDFVEDFNRLLREDERITVKPGELNMELRIYALVRLGINDSVKIAGMLHCSPQTVYNYRLRARNKAAIPKDEFVERVKTLGTFCDIPQQPSTGDDD